MTVLALVASVGMALPRAIVADAPSAIQVRLDATTPPSLHVEILQAEPRIGRDIEIFLRVQNLSSEQLERVELTMEQRRADGRVRAFQGDVQEVNLAPGEELYISRRTSALQPRRGDTFVIAALPLDAPSVAGDATEELLQKNGVSERFTISTCTTFCDKCSDRALGLCGEGGVSEYDCSCTESTASCKFKCTP
jgi:hypothetical protein